MSLAEYEKGVQLSYSSHKVMDTCETLYWHEKIAKTKPDKDYEENEAFGIGKAFHQVLEKTLHKKYVKELLMEAMEEHGVEITDYPVLEAMLKKYVTLHKLSELTVVHCELKIDHPKYVGYIDMIMVAPDGTWWIGDLKTTGKYDVSLLPRLPKDMQLNLYSYFRDFVATQFNLDASKFKGCRYRAVTKPKLVQKAHEATETYIKRLEGNVQVYDIEIPFAGMDPDHAWSVLLEGQARAVQLWNGEAPKRNYSNCIQYHKPCKFFSQCHGHLHSEGDTSVRVHTIESYEDGDLL
jgi:hypothetical protein